MSVINQMLRGLESRDDGAVARSSPSLSNHVDIADKGQVDGWLMALVFAALIGMLGVAAIVWPTADETPIQVTSVHVETQPDPATVTTISPSSSIWEVANEVSSARAQHTDTKTHDSAEGMTPRIGLTEWRIDTSNSVTLLELDLANETEYEVEQSSGELVLRMSDTAMTQVLAPLKLGGTPIASIQTGSDNGDLLMRLRINKPVQTQVYAVQQGDGGYRLLLALQENGGSSPVQTNNSSPFAVEPAAALPVQPIETSIIDKTERQLTAEEKIDQSLADLPRGNTKEDWIARETVSRKAIQNMPGHANARLEYVRALINKNELAEAEAVLLAGLEHSPHHTGLYASLAELKVRARDFLGAIALLKSNLPAASKDPGYIAYLAALYRDQGKNAAAVSLYRRALSMRPQEGLWWMGLGISLEGAEAPPKYILQVYQKAEQFTRARPELNSFVAQRMAQLSEQ